ncbi:cytochrome P450 family protein [Embleya hyalina]|uniref:Cytochrome P450 n=1 Tax=Embleya hyalina TaxID=516124 RepID=A0A401YEY7_9ACTN|nr:cytochrome P450 [Embleya hyalina]GCD93163.1 cytochrome P450 [Embleya hyalina]
MESADHAGCPFLDPTGADLHTEAAGLRDRGPATPVRLPGGVRAWSVTRRDTIKFLVSDRRVSRDAAAHWPALRDVPRNWQLDVWVRTDSAFNAHGREHRRLRALIATAFTPRRTEELRPRVQEIVDRLITDLHIVETGQPVDLRAAFARKVPTEVICDLFGVPPHMRARSLHVIDAALHTAADPDQATADYRELRACMGELVAHRRAHPGPDMTSDLIAARDGDGHLTETQLVDTCILMIGAGSDTTVNLILNSVHALLIHPDQHTRLRRASIDWNDVVEETLRLEGPIAHMPLRYAVADIELGEGVTIRRGDAIIIGFGAAGRDPAVHADPDVFDPARADKEHLAFGHGPHYCLGAPLARMEADIALRALFAHFPDLTLAHPERALPRRESFIANGLRELPVLLRTDTS